MRAFFLRKISIERPKKCTSPSIACTSRRHSPSVVTCSSVQWVALSNVWKWYRWWRTWSIATTRMNCQGGPTPAPSSLFTPAKTFHKKSAPLRWRLSAIEPSSNSRVKDAHILSGNSTPWAKITRVREKEWMSLKWNSDYYVLINNQN